MASQSPSSALAQRYAAALFALADEARALDAVAADFRSLQSALDESADLRTLIRSPLIQADDQKRAIAAVMDRGQAGELTRKFVGLLAANRRLYALPEMIRAFLDELSRRRGEMTAHLTSAHPLSEAQVQTLTDRIKQSVGAKVSVDLRVDPALLGGLVVQVGSRLIDSSLKSKLDRMQLAMKGIG